VTALYYRTSHPFISVSCSYRGPLAGEGDRYGGPYGGGGGPYGGGGGGGPYYGGGKCTNSSIPDKACLRDRSRSWLRYNAQQLWRYWGRSRILVRHDYRWSGKLSSLTSCRQWNTHVVFALANQLGYLLGRNTNSYNAGGWGYRPSGSSWSSSSSSSRGTSSTSESHSTIGDEK